MSSTSKLPVSQIGRFQLVKHIATGGMGTVYKVRDMVSHNIVALKVLSPDLTHNPILVERFKREAKHAEKLHHKHIVEVYGCGEADGFYYLVMEYVDGIDLADYIRRKGRIQHEEARRIIIHACKALSHALSMGVIHRDIKPSNFLLANDAGHCRVKLTDLGLSRMADEEEFRVTRSGTTVGTVDYMAPEQARDASLADIRSDIYSLGCTMYHMLAGNPPFSEGGLGERVYKHIAADPPDIREINPSVPPALWTILRRMLAKHPDDRFQTPDEVIEALRSLAEGPTAPPQPVGQRVLPAGAELMDITPPSLSSYPNLPMGPSGRATITPVPDSDAEVTTRPSSETARKRSSTPLDIPSAPDEGDTLGVTPEQRQAASQQFAHASEVVRSKGDTKYALQLLLSCVKLDPGNTIYRKVLREVGRAHGGEGGWFTSLTTIPARARLRSARRANDHRKALELGEELLTRVPDDISVQLELAASAEALCLPSLATWMLDEARQHAAPGDVTALKALAGLYERRRMLKHAIHIWDMVRKADPYDTDAPTKVKDLAASETIARTNQARR